VDAFRIPLHLEERAGLARTAETIRIGVPFQRGLIHRPDEVVVTDSAERVVPHQAAALGFWPDRSIKWLLVDALVSIGPLERTSVYVRRRGPDESDPRRSGLQVTRGDGRVEVDTGAARFQLAVSHAGPLAAVRIGGKDVLGDRGTRLRLVDHAGKTYSAVTHRLAVEDEGALRVTVVAEGEFRGERDVAPVLFKSCAVFVAGSAAVSLDVRLRNPRAAHHVGGLWDLGDRGSCLIRDLSLDVFPRDAAQTLRWFVDTPGDEHEERAGEWSIQQNSSGGERWDSINHVDADGRPTVSFRGYRIVRGPNTSPIEGHRASPGVTVVTPSGWVAAATRDFWQNFPKALRWRDGALSVGLFPGETSGPHELQGGEQKRHTIWLEFGASPAPSRVRELQHPVSVCVDPAWVEASRAVAWFVAGDAIDPRYRAYLEQIVDGPRAFAARRELIDEYGWRHYGDLYADHEAVRHDGPQPFISHYNNQYDFVYGAFFHFLRTGDSRWRVLMEDLARHVIDIDIYHTQQDKAAFNGGLFWHTDHYLPAATCTHRTYSKANSGAGGYGGGPSNEHNYTSGLLHYFYLTGDGEAADAVVEMADWVLGLDDGARTMFALIDAGPTGAASKTLEWWYQHPGRGAGNSINALLDAYAVSRDRKYLAKAEELIQRCIHPEDDIASLALDDPEHRWSYLVFLQIVGKYLSRKLEMGETDYAFHHARESLMHYAAWMAAHEVPYKDVLHKVELPTETWPAHDVRKAQILHIAARCSDGAQRAQFEERAVFFFDRCLTDLLTFSTSYLTRPLVILSVHGASEAYFRKHADDSWVAGTAHNHVFGRRDAFVPQRARLRATLTSRGRAVLSELSRVLNDVVYRLRRSAGRR